jgi:flagellar motility protein MotE (MotC chaperone)
MKLTFKDILAIAAISLVSFPVLYLVILFSTGNLRFEFGPKPPEQKREEGVRLIKLNKHRDSLLALHSESYKALVKQRAELEEKEKLLKSQEERAIMLEQELEQQKLSLETQREMLEKTVEGSEAASDKKGKQLSRVYGAMRPAEAAQIIETLTDDMAVQILQGIDDERQKGKIMSALSKQKAARMSRIMSGK